MVQNYRKFPDRDLQGQIHLRNSSASPTWQFVDNNSWLPPLRYHRRDTNPRRIDGLLAPTDFKEQEMATKYAQFCELLDSLEEETPSFCSVPDDPNNCGLYQCAETSNSITVYHRANTESWLSQTRCRN